ncbi:KpsF/GutQ family sugar-phosphate isomerase [Alphaproteobacteria bacterium]|nr:KpsF/GutQ family sugar-phosphate isomerase [Alphaproteobacteria bacterium]
MNKKQILNEAKKVLSTEIKGIKTISKSFNEEFYQVVKAIFETKGRTIITGIGKSGHIANKISATLTSTGTPSHFIHATEANHGDLGGITKKDVILAISNSGQSNELNGVINYAKRYNIPLLSISSNKKGILYQKSNYRILYKKPIEACPNNLAPTSSTTMMLIIGDAIAVSLIMMKGFKKTHFSNFHPGGIIGKDLVKVSEVMHKDAKLPLAYPNEKMSKILIQMTKKSFGCIGVINKKGNLIGIITDGDLRRNMDNKIINKTALDIMTKKPSTVDSSTLVGEAINFMNTKKITSIFICKKNKPIGIVHIHDLLRFST